MPGGFEDDEGVRAAMVAMDLTHREEMEKVKEMEREYQQQLYSGGTSRLRWSTLRAEELAGEQHHGQ